MLCSADENPSITDEIRKNIIELMKIKEESMRYPDMRKEKGEWGMPKNEQAILEIGTFGKQSEKIIQEIGEQLKNFDRNEIDQLAVEDFDFKIIQWAMDYRDRKEEYERFARYYVNTPGGEGVDDLVEYYLIPLMGKVDQEFIDERRANRATPQATYPHPVMEEDSVEKNRIIMEYHFFMPPTGFGFTRDEYRPNLTMALHSLGDWEKSFLVMKKDLDAAILNEPKQHENNRKDKNQGNYHSLIFFLRSPSLISFRKLSSPMLQPKVSERMKKYVEIHFGWLLSEEEGLKLYGEWQNHANRTWDLPEERALAEWIKQMPTPKVMPEPGEDRPHDPNDPNDPFGPPPPKRDGFGEDDLSPE